MTADESRERRLADHAIAIVRASSIPAADRDGVAEELTGHVVASYRELVDSGVEPDAAVERAIAGFGDPVVIAREFQQTYHGWLWASTIGAVLPAAQGTPGRPGVLGWMQLVLWLLVPFAAAGTVIALVSFSPVRLVVAVISGTVSVIVTTLAAIAIGRGARWAVWYAVAELVILVLSGLAETVRPREGFSLSLSGWAALLLLVVAARNVDALNVYAAKPVGGGRITRQVLSGLAAISVFGLLLAPHLPDPTQVGPDDMTMTVSMRCEERPSIPDPNDESEPATTNPVDWTSIITADVSWTRVDVAPHGLDDLDGTGWGDGITVEPLLDGMMTNVAATDLTDGRDLWAQNSEGWHETDRWLGAESRFNIPINGMSLIAGHHYRFMWELVVSAEKGAVTDTMDTVRYAHTDHFAVEVADLTCGQTRTAVPVSVEPGSPLDLFGSWSGS